MLDGPGKSGSQSTPRLLWEPCHGSGLTQRAHPEGARWGGSSERHKRELYHVGTGFEPAATSAYFGLDSPCAADRPQRLHPQFERAGRRRRRATADSEDLAIEDGAFGHLEAEGLVDALGDCVEDGSVGGDFAAALCAGPFFGSAEEGCAYATPTV